MSAGVANVALDLNRKVTITITISYKVICHKTKIPRADSRPQSRFRFRLIFRFRFE